MSYFSEGIRKSSSFDRTVANESKMGAYYTDVAHCNAISRYLEFPEGNVNALEPSIGNGEAILAATGKVQGDGIKIFGVELNERVAQETKVNPLFEEIVNADYLSGVSITPNAFSFVFSNPPYGQDVEGSRYEKRFLERLTPQMTAGGVLVYVIPERVFKEPMFFSILYNRFELRHVLRFHEGEYSKWQQIAIIGVKRKVKNNILRDERIKLLETYENLEEIDFDYEGEKVFVPESDESLLKTFTTVRFPAEQCAKVLMEDRDGLPSNFFKLMSRKVWQKEFVGTELDRPPIHPNKDSMYLLGVCGAGQGLCGDEDEGTLHLQRGTVKIVEDIRENTPGDGKTPGTVIATTRAQVTYKVIQANGMISELV